MLIIENVLSAANSLFGVFQQLLATKTIVHLIMFIIILVIVYSTWSSS